MIGSIYNSWGSMLAEDKDSIGWVDVGVEKSVFRYWIHFFSSFIPMVGS